MPRPQALGRPGPAVASEDLAGPDSSTQRTELVKHSRIFEPHGEELGRHLTGPYWSNSTSHKPTRPPEGSSVSGPLVHVAGASVRRASSTVSSIVIRAPRRFA